MILMVFVVLLISLVPLNLIITGSMAKEIGSIQKNNFLKLTQSIAESLEAELQSDEYILEGFALALSGREDVTDKLDGDPDAVQSSLNGDPYVMRILKKLLEENSFYESVYLADLNGIIRASTDEKLIGKDISQNDCFISVVSVGNEVYTTPHSEKSASTGNPLIAHGAAVREGDLTAGFLGATLDLGRLGHKVILSKKTGKTGEAFLLDKNGTILVHPQKDLVYRKVQEQDPFFQMILDNPLQTMTTPFKKDGVNFQGTFVKIFSLGWTVCFSIEEKEAYFAANKLRNIMFGSSVLLFCVVWIVIFIYIRRKLVLRLDEMGRVISSASRGDLTMRGKETGRDELALMTSHFNGLIETLSGFFRHLARSLEDLDNVGSDLSANTEETMAAVLQIRSNVKGSLSRIDDQEQSVALTVRRVEEISRNIQSLDRNIDNQNGNILQGSQAVEELIGQIKRVSSSIGEAETLMTTLLSASAEGQENVQGVTRMIADIQDQSQALEQANTLISGIAARTNLLAMNAAIEAAHAGQAGRGFAVVADEIRKLAEQSTGQSGQVKLTIKEINSRIDQIVRETERTGGSFSDIHSKINTMSTITNEIHSSMEEQVAGSTQVLSTLEELKSSGRSVSEGSRSMTTANEDIRRAVDDLSRISGEVHKSITEIGSGIDEINSAVGSITDLSLSNRDHIRGVREEAGFFTHTRSPEENDIPEEQD
ncbi:MAG: hypothetical protein JXA95_19140 [Spirochaetales bacterium]|nr:hypothetical protein [Spirochaetales bacterium]